MSSRIALIADGRLVLASEDGASKRHGCTFAEQIEDRQQRMAEKNAWKQELGTGAGAGGGMFQRSALWGQGGGGEPLPRPQIVTVCNGPRPGSMVYTLWTGVVGALLEFDFGEDYERRVFHREQFHASDFDRHPVSGKLVCRYGDEQASNLAVLDPDGRNMQPVTEGDSIDGSPSWVAGEENEIVYHSAGVSRDRHGYIHGMGAFSIGKLNLRRGEIEVVLEEDHHDLLAPRIDGDGNLFFIRRPYEGPGGKRPPLWTTLKDVLLFPFRLVRMVVDFFQIFSQLVSHKPLTTAGAPKVKGPEPVQMWVHGRMIDAAKADKEGPSDGALAPGDWVLVKRSPAGDEEVIAKRVLAYDLARDGRVLLSDGRNVRVVGPDGSRKVLSEALTGTVRWLEDFEGEAGS